MNKKFLSAIMCGAMLTASTSVFVSCEDYGDDIAHLQTQIDQNATTAASELAAKVAALESQLSTLKAAQDGMKDQLANAKAEAAAAANAAAAAAQAAQAAADAAQNGADDAKAAAAAAQAAADAANKGLADAVARVAVLETKVASLEATIAGLTASDKELSAKLNDLQVLANSLKNASDASAEEIKAIKNDIVAKTAELTAQVSKISAEFGAKIDAINAELNTIKANYATKNELNEKAAELAAIDATLAEQIAANEAYIAAMQEAIAALEAEDAELAALIAENQAAALDQIEAANEELAAQKEAVEAEIATINEKIEEVNGALEQLVMAVMGNKSALEDFQVAVETVVADMQDQISQLILQANGNYEAIVAIMENLDNLNTAAGDMQGQIESLITQTGANYEDIVKILEALEEQAGWNKDIQTIIVNLQESYLMNDGILEGMINDLKAVVEGQADQIKALQDWAAAYDAKYEDFVKAQEEAIAAELAKLENISAGLVAAQANIAELQNKIDAVINGLQSVAFVPMYNNTEFDIPVYHIDTYTKDAKGVVIDGTDLYPVSTIKFRLEPAGYAKQLAEIYAENNNVLELESADKLAATRATAAANYLKIESVVADGDYLVLGVSKKDNMKGNYPTTLVVSNKTAVSQTTNEEGETVAKEITLSKTSDYFTVKFDAEDATKVNNQLAFSATPKSNVKATQEVNALNVASTVNMSMYHNVFDAYSIVGSAATELVDATGATLPYDGKNISSNLRVVAANGTVFTDKVKEVQTPYFTVKADGTIAVNSTKEGLPIEGNVGKTITVQVVDDAYQLNGSGEDYVVYNYTFTIVENTYVYDIPNFVFAMEWPKTTVAAQKITVATIAADQANLDEYKLTAKDVFEAMYAQVGAGMTLNNGTLTVELKAVAKTDKEEAHITVTPTVSLTQNYNQDITWNKAYTFVLEDLEAKVTFGVNVDLSIPGLDKFFEKINMYWLGEGDNTLQVNYHLVDVTEGGKKYQYYVDMTKVYMFHNTDVDYTWTLDAVTKTENGKTETATLSGIEFDGSMFNFTAPVVADYPTLKDENLDVANLTFTAEASHNATSFGKHINQKFNVTYPISAGDFVAPNNVEFDMDDLKSGKEFEVTKGVSLTDRDGNTWIHEGKILTASTDKLVAVATEWGIENLKYTISKVMSDGQDLTKEGLFELPATGGKLTVTRPENITKDVTVTIKVSVDYTYAKGISAEYNVIVVP